MRAFFLGVVAALWGTGDPAVAQSVDEQAALEALFPISEDAGPGFVLQVLRPDHDPLTITRGFANLEHSVAISEQTAFHIASLSKQITAGVLAVAILEARVSLDDPLSRWVPEAAHWGGDLTLAHLVYMTSGIPEYYDLDRASGQPWSTHYFFTPDEAIETVLAQADLRFC